MLQEIQPLRFLTSNKVWARLASINAKRKVLIQLILLLFQLWDPKNLPSQACWLMRIPSDTVTSSGLNTLPLTYPARQAFHFSESTGSLYLHLLYSNSCLSTEVRATHRTPGLTHAHFVQKSSLYRKSVTQCVLFFPGPCHPTGNSCSPLFLLHSCSWYPSPQGQASHSAAPCWQRVPAWCHQGRTLTRWSISPPQHWIITFPRQSSLNPPFIYQYPSKFWTEFLT